jgi:hypothetical protein
MPERIEMAARVTGKRDREPIFKTAAAHFLLTAAGADRLQIRAGPELLRIDIDLRPRAKRRRKTGAR